MKKSVDATLVSVIYHHPEAFPPTLNAIGELSGRFKKIYLVYRPLLDDEWVYPSNVVLKPSGRRMSADEQDAASLSRKVGFFMWFVYKLLQVCRTTRPSIILAYDPIALFACSLVRPFIRHSFKLWYHNHDIAELHTIRKYSIGWWAAKKQDDALRHLSVFSLPSNERLPYFNLSEFKGKYFHIPNYPARSFYDLFYTPRKPNEEIRIIFQGSIGDGHGFEELIGVLNKSVCNKRLRLILKGKCSQEYKDSLMALAKRHGTSEKLEFFGMTSYREVPVVGATCHVGLAIFMKTDVMNRTLGTASNKIYEYAALGMPVLYNRDIAFASHLARFEWTVPVDVSGNGLLEGLQKVVMNYESLSEKAHADFKDTLNFETHFEEVKNYVHLNGQE